MPSNIRLFGASLLALTVGCGGLAGAATPPPAPFTTQVLHFEVHVGAGQTETCDVLGELVTPAGAGPDHRLASLLMTNGFGGSYQDQVGIAEKFATYGYVGLTYSGLGFGGSGCKITLDDPLYDGQAASQLVSFLGGENGIAFTDASHTDPVPGLTDVIHDATDHLGHKDQFDPRVGMIGGSYGGENQFAVASIDPRVDTIVPIITWNNLAYSLAPNDAAATPGVTDYTPGVIKSTWAALFSVDGLADGIAYAKGDPARLLPCPNFATWVCPGLALGAGLGYPYPALEADLEHASVSSYMSSIRIPTLLMQGENDTLFNLNEAIANYQALRAQGTPVSMIWQSWGHSDLTPAPGEISLSNPDPLTQYETLRVYLWFAHYLQGKSVPTGPAFAYFRDWVHYSGNASPAYGTASSFPVGSERAYVLSGGHQLVAAPAQPTVGTEAFVTPPAGAPTSLTAPDAVGSELGSLAPDFGTNVPGTYAAWTTAPLTSDVDVVGEPDFTVKVTAPTAALAQRAGPAGELVLFAKLYDVAPDGKAQLIHGLVAPVRVNNVDEPIRITLPAVVHQFAKGDQIEIMLAGGDTNYRGGPIATTVLVTSGSTGQVLDLPVVNP